MQVLLILSLKRFGENVRLQLKISLGVAIFFLIALTTKVVIISKNEATINETYKENENEYQAFGFEFKTLDNGQVVFDTTQCLLFEIIVLVITAFQI